MMFNKFPCVVEPWQPVAEVTTWSSTISFASSPSSCKKHTAFALEDGNGGGATKSGEEFCMISGRHSCTLERLYAWEKKLFDEVKASETIRKEYDQKCRLLANSYARDLKSEAIDRTRASVKDLHSQLLVSIQAVDLISKKIEQLRDDELQPQIVELTHGLVLMWKGMLKCHHAQFITISLAYHAKSSIETVNKTSYMQALMQLYDEVCCFGSSFAKWIDSHKLYAESLNGWLQKCILPSNERSVGRKMVVTHCRALSPPIFALFQGWLVGMGSLPSKGLLDAIRSLASVLHDELLNERKMHKDGREGEGSKLLESRLSIIQTSLKCLFDQLAKVSEAAIKVFEDV
ncbi:hypothetical protein HPP92_009240 [Vanilla planifolia]|uniref:DUF632 domain-containing protein n=1 Tax=Vanilla planifolia TaxID=51239 RepID=A0A835R9M5_VANPL|nr:hypothetical protein HPP92_009240 [Vanilla planifolia]